MTGLTRIFSPLLLVGILFLFGSCDQKPSEPVTPVGTNDSGDVSDPADTALSGGVMVPPGNYFPISPGSVWDYWDGYGVELQYGIEGEKVIDGMTWSVKTYSNRDPAYFRREGMVWYCIDSNVGIPYVYLNLDKVGTKWLVHYMDPGGDSSRDRSWFEVAELLPTHEVEGLLYHDVVRVTELKQTGLGAEWLRLTNAEYYYAKGVGLIEKLQGRYGLIRNRVLLGHRVEGENAPVDTTERFDADRVKGGWFYAKLDGEDWIPEKVSFIDEGPDIYRRHEIWAWQWPGRYGAHLRFMFDSLQPGVYEFERDSENKVDFYVNQNAIFSGSSGSFEITRNDAYRIEGRFSFQMDDGRSFTDGEFYIEK